MNCRRVQRLLFDYQDGLLSAQLAESIAAHLRDCHTCRRLRNAARAAEGKLHAMADGQPDSHRSPRHEALRRWIAERQADPRLDRRWLQARWTRPLGAAIGAVLVGIVTLLFTRWDHTPLNVASIPRAGDRPPTARASDLARTVVRPHSTLQQPRDDAGQDVTQSGSVSPGTEHDGRAASPPVNGGPVRFQSRLKAAGIPRPALDLQPASAGFTNRQAPRLRRDKDTPIGVLDDAAHAPKTALRPWTALPGDAYEKIETAVRRHVPVRDDFVRIPFPRIAATSDRQIAMAVESYQREAAIVDARLSREVTVLQKATPLSDLCERLRADTGIQLGAGPSVADEKVTVFCEKLPLRDVMRQLSRPFGYTWLRSGKTGEYKYELVQDLRSQLLEEELRNRDRNEALLSLEREIDRYRPSLQLSPDEALARTKTVPPAEKPLLEKLASFGWGPIHMYFRLSRNDLAALRGGQTLTFSGAPDPGQQPLPLDLARGVFQSFRGYRVYKERDLSLFSSEDPPRPDAVPLATVPEVRARITLTMPQSELGQFSLEGSSGIFFPRAAGTSNGLGPYAVGRSPTVLKPDNQKVNAKYATDPVLTSRAAIQPGPSCRPVPVPSTGDGSVPEPKVTTADVLEALHRATGLPMVADYYTHLYKPSAVSARNQTLFGALNQLADAMGLRWSKEANWLQFRSASYYDDRLKEVPNRLLEHWAALRRKQGSLTLDDLIEIAQLPDAQLDGAEMAEGARECFGLTEWDLARSERLRPRLRFLASFTPAQRHDVVTPEGLPFTRMSLAQQQQFITEATLYDPLSLNELAGASIRVDYSQPGEFQWGNPDLDWHWSRWVIILEHGRQGRWAPRPLLRARTREAVVQAVLRLDPKIREAAVHTFRSQRPTPEPEPPVPLEAPVFPTRLSLTFLYFPAASNLLAHIEGSGASTWQILY